MKKLLFFLCILTGILACSEEKKSIEPTKEVSSEGPLFELQDPAKTGLNFNNLIIEDDVFNVFRNDPILQGAGVGVLDINNDGKKDLYFAGNMVSDRLYLNNGDLTFKDVSKEAGIEDDGSWSTGVVIVDINTDGYDDIYVCKFLLEDPEKRKNKLYVNNQDGTFTEKAADYGIADGGYSIMANFFDYDGDNDLDLYVANQPPSSNEIRKKTTREINYAYTDRLYQNQGNNTFKEVTEAAGVKNYCFSLSATVSDFNGDDLPDLYVTSDYEEPDLLYQNNGDGTFTNIAATALKHMSNFSMGADVADINNDGYTDIFTADMVAEGNFRNKTNMSSMAVEKFWALVKRGYHYQYMFNALQLNNGNGTFSEIAQMSGIAKTDWSWASLFLDADHDGFKDLFVTNGIYKEIRNKDYENKLKKFIADKKADEAGSGAEVLFDPLELSSMAPSVKLRNRVYRNKGNLMFENKVSEWGFEKSNWSQGMAYFDADDDGDLDLIINNMNEEPELYINQHNNKNNALSVAVKGPSANTKGLNSKVRITYGEGLSQIMEITPYRGYMSSCEAIAHFGVGDVKTIDEVSVIFSDGKEWTQKNVPVNKKLVAEYSPSLPQKSTQEQVAKVFTDHDQEINLRYLENEYDDYAHEVLIPYKMSNLGPAMAVGDVNNDGNDDFYLGGAALSSGRLMIQTDDGYFTELSQPFFEADRNYEDGGAVFVDIDKDGDLDLYVASGGNEYPANSVGYQDRLYINSGGGVFVKTKNALPAIVASTSAICPMDFDGDGDMDFFVGGRQVPLQYGIKADSYLLENNGATFVDVTQQKASIFNRLGMVTDADWKDIDGDNQAELVVVGEWMPVTVMKFNNGTFQLSNDHNLADTKGLWNHLTAEDVDNDGDTDLIAGNFGLNYKYKASKDEPFKLYVSDFDDNGTNDVYLGYYDGIDGKLYPVRGRECSSEQMPFVAEKFETYNAFGSATLEDVLQGRMEEVNIEECQTFAHHVFLNDGKGRFSAHMLPIESQIAPIYDIAVTDVDNDSHKDIICVGNFHQREIETTRSDAGVGTILLGDGNGQFRTLHPSKTGIIADRDARALALLKNEYEEPVLAIANNGSEMQFYRMGGE